MNYYTVYDPDTDEILARGTAKECAGTLGFVSTKSFRTMVSRIEEGKSSRYAVVVDRDLPENWDGLSRQAVWEEDVRERWERIQRRFLAGKAPSPFYEAGRKAGSWAGMP